MISLSSIIESGGHIPKSIAELPHYSTNELRGLPPDASPIGVLANGDVYYSTYDMLTPDDISFLKRVTGRSFDPAAIAAERAAGTFQGDPLAAAIGDARADFIHGWGGLGDAVDKAFLESVKSAMSNPLGDGTYQGILISQSELAAAFSALGRAPSTCFDLSV